MIHSFVIFNIILYNLNELMVDEMVVDELRVLAIDEHVAEKLWWNPGKIRRKRASSVYGHVYVQRNLTVECSS